jgi:hypothetical protein
MNKLILDQEINDEMLFDFMTMLHSDEVEVIQVDTNNISSLALQQLFCAEKTKEIVCNNSFIEKLFSNIVRN